ncbi:MAG: GNAT family N-acetyltransferase [Ilumatobacter sp.]|uniref:GNAT family N-acetyltransferase n=1 Tax=Ilumatobacter sp. TaxID=1967498 RepID=UPI0026183FA2|nr:GNAT family N-acetyltransferase [Ilumatobacter sp.]MDJ0771090.1 GNAT family N-acetyltransferase [Ilumatobacter sp.]
MIQIRHLAADHPALTADIERFLVTLRTERRYFGPSASSNPKPFRSLIADLGRRDGRRWAAIECGTIIGLARVDETGRLHLAVAPDRRRCGVGTALARHAVEGSEALGPIVLRSTRRSHAARRLAARLGCDVVDRGRGRTDLVIDLEPTTATDL